MIVMVAGVYGVGKSTICSKLSNDLKLNFYSASELIKAEQGFSTWDKNKQTGGITKNQDYLYNAINKKANENFMLDGHFCLRNKSETIEIINFKSIKNLGIKAVLLLKEDPDIICDRLMNRDGITWSKDFIFNMQKTEEEQAINYTKENSIPFSSRFVNEYNAIKDFVEKSFFLRTNDE
ncbi:AAA family ATPase [Pectobacterium brasiliense]|nr:AAA family ATPase [Pectobacterium brasiliense]